MRFFAGGKNSIFCTGFRVSKSWMKTPQRLVESPKKHAVRGWNLQNTRIVPNPGDVLVVGSKGF